MKSWRTVFGLGISLVFLYIAFRGQDFDQIRDALSKVNYFALVPALLLYFAGVWVRAIRWSVLLRPVTPASARQVFPLVMVGYTANNVMPLRTGEVVRAFLLGRRFGVRKTATLATIAVERLFDGLTMLAFMLIATAFVSFTSELRHVALIAFGLFAALLIGVFILTLGGDFRDRLLQVVLGPLPTSIADRVERMAESFLSGLAVFRHRRDLALVAGSSLLAWLFEASMYWTIARGFGGALTDALGVAATLMTTGVANLATLIPSSPGYVGPFEAAVVLVVNGALGVDRSVALSYAIVVHAALWLPITVLGAFEWWRQLVKPGVEVPLDAEVPEAGADGHAQPEPQVALRPQVRDGVPTGD